MKLTVAVDENLLEVALREEALDIRSLRDHVGILPDYDYKVLRREEP